MISENNILSSIAHPLIVGMHGYCQDSKFLYLVLEYIAGGELFTYLRGVGRFDPQQAW